MNDDSYYLKKAIDLSLTNMNDGQGGPFGALIVKNGKIIGEGWNQVTSTNDPTAHAEIAAIRAAAKATENFHLKGATIYTSCEPCPMCLAAIYWAHIDKIIYANNRNDAAEIGFDDEFLYEEIIKPVNDRKIPMVQMMRDEALKIFKEWQRKEDKIEY